MYEEYWGLESGPFDEDARPGFLFRWGSFEAALSKLLYVVESGSGAAVLTAPAGCGKTLLAGCLMAELMSRGRTVARLAAPLGGEADLLSGMLAALGDDETDRTPGGGLAERLQKTLIEQLELKSASGEPVVAVIDDAQAVDQPATIERLRMLLEPGEEGAKRLVLFMVGRPEAHGHLAAAGFDERMSVAARIEPMNDDESKAYILHRLEAAGSSRGIFTEEAAGLIVATCKGAPRRLNRLCDLCLAMGYSMGVERVGPDVVGEVIADLEA